MSQKVTHVLGSLALAAHGMRPDHVSFSNPTEWHFPVPLVTEAFEKYQGYEGGLVVTGKVFIGGWSGSVAAMSGSFSGVDDKCDGTQTGEGNKCGIHIHAGTECSDAKGHFYNKEALSEDPWTPITYKITETLEGSLAQTAQVDNKLVTMNLKLGESDGRVFVVHDSTGARVACAKLRPVQFSGGPTFAVKGLGLYPGYGGSLKVDQGVVAIQQSGFGADQVLGFGGKGGDPVCTDDFVPTKPNGCGVHIHKGGDCFSAGGHLFASAKDPWLKVRYVVAPDGFVSGVTPVVATEVALNADQPRTVVVHDATGTRISCSEIDFSPTDLSDIRPPDAGQVIDRFPNPGDPSDWHFPVPLETEAFEKYPGYEGGLVVTGKVVIGGWSDSVAAMSGSFSGVDDKCDGTQTGEGNKCGIHIHAGTECSDAKGHFYDKEALSEDPWTPITYKMTETLEGALAQTAQVDNKLVTMNLKLGESDGRVFVVHDSTGARVACAKLRPVQFSGGSTFAVKGLPFYPGYNGSLKVDQGVVAIQQSGFGADQVLGFGGKGGDPVCTDDFVPTKPNGCGVHIHKGKDCSAAGGHLFASAKDPWLKVRYVVTPDGLVSGVTPVVATEVALNGQEKRTVVVHDATGKRISCGEIDFSLKDLSDIHPPDLSPPSQQAPPKGGASARNLFALLPAASIVVLVAFGF